MRLFHSSMMLPVISISLTGWVIFPLLKAKPSMPKEKSPVAGLQLPPLNPVTSIPFEHLSRMVCKDTSFSSEDKSMSFRYGINTGRLRSSIVGGMSILRDMYVFTKYLFTIPFSMIGVSSVATPSVSNRREPLLPGVLARSISVIPSGKIFLSRLSSRKETFCCIDDALRAEAIGDISLEAT